MHIVEAAISQTMLPNRPKTAFVAYSGGSDSTALLMALNRVYPSLPLTALHVNHRLNANSDAWEKHCVSECRDLGVEIHVTRLNLSLVNNIEAAAREKRYAFFSKFLEESDVLFVGHHLQDQVETTLMRIFQGRGIIQMPLRRNLGQGTLVRPFLGLKPEILREYLSILRRSWVEDDSNSDESFTRNYIRSAVLPSISERWPNYLDNVARALFHSKNQEKILDGFYGKFDDCFAASELPDGLDERLVWIRKFLDAKKHFMVSDRQIKAFINQIENSSTGAIDLDDYIFGHYRGMLYYEMTTPEIESEIRVTQFPYKLDLGWGILLLEEVTQKDCNSFSFANELMIKFRAGNRKMKLTDTTYKKSVKNLFNENRLPRWRRSSFPLIFSDGDLVCLPGIGVDTKARESSSHTSKNIRARVVAK